MTSQASFRGLRSQMRLLLPREDFARDSAQFSLTQGGNNQLRCFLGKRSNRSLHHSSNFNSKQFWLPGSESNRGPRHARFLLCVCWGGRTLVASFKDSRPTTERPGITPPLTPF